MQVEGVKEGKNCFYLLIRLETGHQLSLLILSPSPCQEVVNVHGGLEVAKCQRAQYTSWKISVTQADERAWGH